MSFEHGKQWPFELGCQSDLTGHSDVWAQEASAAYTNQQIVHTLKTTRLPIEYKFATEVGSDLANSILNFDKPRK